MKTEPIEEIRRLRAQLAAAKAKEAKLREGVREILEMHWNEPEGLIFALMQVLEAS